jgi:hypothetical protein
MRKHLYFNTGKGSLECSGLTLNKDAHEYFFKGHELSGITGLVGKKLKKKFESTFVEEGRAQGSHIHDAIEYYIRTGLLSSVHPAARWAINELKGFEEDGHKLYSEVLVSDFKQYASAIDILDVVKDNQVIIFDTKAGNFSRDYVSWQLGVYKYFLEGTTDYEVMSCYCLSTKDRDFYPIIPRSAADVKGLLYKVGVK